MRESVADPAGATDSGVGGPLAIDGVARLTAQCYRYRSVCCLSMPALVLQTSARQATHTTRNGMENEFSLRRDGGAVGRLSSGDPNHRYRIFHRYTHIQFVERRAGQMIGVSSGLRITW